VPLERTELKIQPGKEVAFADAMRTQGVAVLQSVPGVVAVHFGRGVENPDKFLLMVDWESMEAHTAYKGTPPSLQIRDLILPYSAGAAMEHFEMLQG